jgi:hypothetical protein
MVVEAPLQEYFSVVQVHVQPVPPWGTGSGCQHFFSPCSHSQSL